ncbi:MAG TPA: DoxX family protein [Gemmatimonadales bacterium]|nr:DoxX family protein [Gemmatimonadales bacterium]
MNHTPVTSPVDRALAFFLRPSVGDRASRATVVLRGAVGGVFLVSGAVKFLFDNQGPGRFAKLGFHAASEVSSFVGGVEIACGALLILGLFTRLAAVPLVVDMIVALATTKVPLLFGAGPEPVAALPRTGFWAFAYQARLDATMLLASLYIVAAGAGLWSIDAILARRRWEGALLGKVRHHGDAPPLAE